MPTTTEPMLLSAALATGFVLGLRHALDPDHIAAVSTLSVRRKEYSGILRLAVWWGLGHTATIALAAVVVAVLKSAVPPAVEASLEAVVGLMLIFLGGRLLFRRSDHEADNRHAHAQRHGRTERQSFLIGAVHGLAGSAAVLLLAAVTIQSAAGLALFILVFGAGSIGGMLLFTGVLGIPITYFGSSAGFERAFGIVASIASIVVGIIVVASSIGRLA